MLLRLQRVNVHGEDIVCLGAVKHSVLNQDQSSRYPPDITAQRSDQRLWITTPDLHLQEGEETLRTNQ